MTPKELKSDPVWSAVIASAGDVESAKWRTASRTAFTIRDVVEVLIIANNDDFLDDRLGLFRLRGDRYLFVAAVKDSGKPNGYYDIASSREELRMTDAEKEELVSVELTRREEDAMDIARMKKTALDDARRAAEVAERNYEAAKLESDNARAARAKFTARLKEKTP